MYMYSLLYMYTLAVPGEVDSIALKQRHSQRREDRSPELKRTYTEREGGGRDKEGVREEEHHLQEANTHQS